MSACATQATPHDDRGQHAADPHGHRQVLNDLIGMGADLARLLHAQAAQQAAARFARDVPAHASSDAQPVPPYAPDALATIAAAFDRTARSVRRCIALARILDQPVPSAPDPARRRTDARKQVIREVEDRIGRARGADADDDGPDGPAALHAELRDRLDAPDLDDDLAHRPVADVIAEICRDLGLAAPSGTQPWKRRTPADLRLLRASAAAPSLASQPGAGPDPAHGPASNPGGTWLDTPSAIPPPQPWPIPAGNGPPDGPAAALAAIPGHPAEVQGRWPSPFSDWK